MLSLLLDIVIYNYSSYKSFFFLVNISNKSLVCNIVIGLIIDIYITHTYFLTTIYILIIYLISKYFKLNYYNLLIYYLYNIITILLYYILISLIFNTNLYIIPNILFINSLYILICYKGRYKNILFDR